VILLLTSDIESLSYYVKYCVWRSSAYVYNHIINRLDAKFHPLVETNNISLRISYYISYIHIIFLQVKLNVDIIRSYNLEIGNLACYIILTYAEILKLFLCLKYLKVSLLNW
jgi:hypothetical protein